MSVAVSVLSAVGMAVLAAPSASADVTSYTKTRTFEKTKNFYSAPLSRCVRVKITGTMSAFYVRSTQTYPTPADYQSLQDPRLEDLTMQVTTTDTCFDGSPRENVTKATLRQSYYYWKCSSNPGISVGYPWSVGLSVTPTCGEEKVAKRSTTYSDNGSRYTQYNSGVKAEWDKLSSGPTSTDVSSCIHGVADVTVYRPGKSDSVKFDMGNICITV
ncbi:hypothetical protein [uncultured Phycicoccus sp.]|uniref:hypothetical protein n=1 Tax=uncultured Phycicoccus sp. TaxID=661422 RepID=UPI002628EB40|nr:hypothetical protein [uncultured Phycicoccus sp.]